LEGHHERVCAGVWNEQVLTVVDVSSIDRWFSFEFGAKFKQETLGKSLTLNFIKCDNQKMTNC